MLIISQNLTATLSRPKYHPRLRHPQWVVLQTAPMMKAKRVYGPAAHQSCMRFMGNPFVELELEVNHDKNTRL